MLVDAVDIVGRKNNNLLWPYNKEDSRWHYKVVRIDELGIYGLWRASCPEFHANR